MCGIRLYLNLLKRSKYSNEILFNNFMKIKNRGPDNSIFNIYNNLVLGFHRLQIMDLNYHSNQPYVLEFEDKTILFICNGEIYNYKDLIIKHGLDISTHSDCLTIPKLYIKYYYEYEIFKNLFSCDIKGEYSFVLIELNIFKKYIKYSYRKRSFRREAFIF